MTLVHHSIIQRELPIKTPQESTIPKNGGFLSLRNIHTIRVHLTKTIATIIKTHPILTTIFVIITLTTTFFLFHRKAMQKQIDAQKLLEVQKQFLLNTLKVQSKQITTLEQRILELEKELEDSSGTRRDLSPDFLAQAPSNQRKEDGDGYTTPLHIRAFFVDRTPPQ